MRVLLLVCLVSLTCSSLAQNPYIRPTAESIPEAYRIDVPNLREHLLTTIPEEYREEKYQRISQVYCDNVAHSLSNHISSGFIYSDWDEMEEYLNKVMREILPDDMKEDQMVHAYISRNPHFNASMTPSGHMFVNVGTFSYLDSEAELAALLAHEVAHYQKNHSLRSFYMEQNGELDYGLASADKKKKAHEQEQELEADQISMELMLASDYELEGEMGLLRLLERLEKQRLRRNKSLWKLKANTHPLSQERIQQCLDFKAAHGNKLGKRFIHGKEQFFKLKKEAVIEALESHLRQFNYRSATELAFKYHLFYPNEEVFIYYLMEGIRRMCYQDKTLWNKNFMTNYYYESKTSNDQKNKVEMKDHVFEKFDPELMAFSPTEMRSVAAQFYWKEECKFRTYDEALEFYNLVSENIDCTECKLSYALSLVEDETAFKKSLNGYMAQEDAMNKDYAKALIDDQVFEGLEKKKLTIFENMSAYIRQGQEPIPVQINTDEGIQDLMTLYDSIMTVFPERSPIYMKNLISGSLEEYMIFLELRDLSRTRTLSKGGRLELHIIDPRYLSFFKRFEVNELEFLTCTYSEFRKKEKSVDAYQEAMGTTYSELFDQQNSTRFMEFYITSVMMQEKGFMKFRYYSKEIKLNFKKRTFNEFVLNMRQQLRTKDDRLTKAGYHYRE